MTRRTSFSFHFTDTTTVSWPFRIFTRAGASVVLPARITMPARAVTLRGSRVMAVTVCLRESASSRTRLPMFPVAPIRAMLLTGWFLS